MLHTETFSDYKSAREREKFLKSGKGRKWLDKLEAESKPAKQPAGKARPDQPSLQNEVEKARVGKINFI